MVGSPRRQQHHRRPRGHHDPVHGSGLAPIGALSSGAGPIPILLVVVVLYIAWLILVQASSHRELTGLVSLSRYLLLLIVSCLTMAVLGVAAS